MNLQKLSIRGIRSFGPSDVDVQNLFFLSPVTLIVGANGTGKTTIIECIRYSVTGEMPSGSKQGASFIYDLKLANENEIRGQVRLSFTDISGKMVKVQRSLCAGLPPKGKQVTLRTLENAVSRLDEFGNVSQISSKCADVDREIVRSLGVSKAILENVIFCHQEDCNWPLAEGKVVKSKFDDIFATTKYVKALEEIRKIRQEKGQQLKLSSVEIVHLRRNRDRASEIKKQILDLERSNAENRNELKVMESKVPEHEMEVKSISSQIEHYHQIHDELAHLKAQKKCIEKRIEDLSTSIDQTWLDCVDSVEAMKSVHSQKVELSKRNMNAREAHNQQLKRSLQDVVSEMEKKNGELAVLNCELSNMDKSRTLLNERRSGFSEMVENLLEKRANESTNMIELVAECRSLFERKNNERKSEELVFSRKFNEQNSKTRMIEQNKTILEGSEESLKRTIDRTKDSIRELECSAQLLVQIERQIEGYSVELSEFDQSKIVEMKEKAQRLTEDKKLLSDELKKCDEQMCTSLKYQEIRTEIDIARKQLNQKTRQMQNLMDLRGAEIEQVLGTTDISKFTVLFNEKSRYQNDQLNEFKQTEQKLLNDQTTYKSRLEIKKADIVKTESLIHNFSNRLSQSGIALEEESAAFEHITVDPQKSSLNLSYRDIYEKKSNELKNRQDEKGFMSGIEKTYNKFIRKLSTATPPQCPLCHRDFKEKSEVDDLIDEMEKTIETVPASQAKIDSEIEKVSQQFQEILALKPMMEQLNEAGFYLNELKSEVEKY